MTTWMIVEDEPDLHAMFLAICEVLGVEGIGFYDGEDAIAWIESVESGEFEGELPELAVLDYRLPTAISGPMIGARIRESSALKHMALVLTTAAHMTPEREQAFLDTAQTTYLIRKPWPRFQWLEGYFRDAVKAQQAQAQFSGHE
jgi:CheY-like chemotaxis protein